LRSAAQRWDPRAQRPELWSLYNLRMRPGESVRVFPLSNWTELDVWRYILREAIEVVRLYFAAERPVVRRDGLILMVDDERFRLGRGEQVETRRVRFRTLGCYPLTGAIDSEAADLAAIVAEMERATTSERQGRAIDKDGGGHAMERKKLEGYF
jgi:sulfate adenylyltransferase subunit 2